MRGREPGEQMLVSDSDELSTQGGLERRVAEGISGHDA
jgi:hypothetical protein